MRTIASDNRDSLTPAYYSEMCQSEPPKERSLRPVSICSEKMQKNKLIHHDEGYRFKKARHCCTDNPVGHGFSTLQKQR